MQNVKTFLMKSIHISVKGLLFLFITTSLWQCKKDEDHNQDVNNQLNGLWDVTSFKSNGVEQMQTIVATFQMEYLKETDSKGTTEWIIVSVLGDTDEHTGEYEITDDGGKLKLAGDEFDVEINNDLLTLTKATGVTSEIHAERH